MKKLGFLKFAAAILALATVTFMTSCSKDDDGTETVDQSPVLNLLGGEGYTSADATIKVGDTIMVGITATANATSGEKLVKFTAVFTSDDEPYTVLDSTFKNESFSTVIILPCDYPLSGKLALTITDNAGKIATKTLNVTVESNETPLTEVAGGGMIYNLLGSEKGAWDLVADVAKSSTDDAADKDLINTTTVGSTTPEIFEEEWTCSNGTMYVKATGFDYNNATVESAATAYAAGSASATVSDVAVDDIYVAKLRGGTDYAVLKITAVTVTDDNNDDVIKFSYKK